MVSAEPAPAWNSAGPTPLAGRTLACSIPGRPRPAALSQRLTSQALAVRAVPQLSRVGLVRRREIIHSSAGPNPWASCKPPRPLQRRPRFATPRRGNVPPSNGSRPRPGRWPLRRGRGPRGPRAAQVRPAAGLPARPPQLRLRNRLIWPCCRNVPILSETASRRSGCPRTSLEPGASPSRSRADGTVILASLYPACRHLLRPAPLRPSRSYSSGRIGVLPIKSDRIKPLPPPRPSERRLQGGIGPGSRQPDAQPASLHPHGADLRSRSRVRPADAFDRPFQRMRRAALRA